MLHVPYDCPWCLHTSVLLLPLAYVTNALHINCENGLLTSTVYRKKIHTDQLFNFDSNHLVEHQRSVVRTKRLSMFFHFQICSPKWNMVWCLCWFLVFLRLYDMRHQGCSKDHLTNSIIFNTLAFLMFKSILQRHLSFYCFNIPLK